MPTLASVSYAIRIAHRHWEIDNEVFKTLKCVVDGPEYNRDHGRPHLEGRDVYVVVLIHRIGRRRNTVASVFKRLKPSSDIKCNL